jgi:hypothetical protein
MAQTGRKLIYFIPNFRPVYNKSPHLSLIELPAMMTGKRFYSPVAVV